ncbi:MAG: hypothetical protein D6690_13755 [Nitrospirae bacterium]|nr:MAG: hypothetical protein D6690_13755 [Nitrospirota bacterium]
MNRRDHVGILVLLAVCGLLLLSAPALAVPYELTRNNVEDPNAIDAREISLYKVKLGDPESKAIELLVEEKIPGVRAEQEGVFILLWDKRNPTGAMAGVRIMDGKVDLIFINNRFAHKTRGIFRRVLTAKSADQIRQLLGPEDYGDENVMGAMLNYESKGFLVNYLGRDINVEFYLR